MLGHRQWATRRRAHRGITIAVERGADSDPGPRTHSLSLALLNLLPLLLLDGGHILFTLMPARGRFCGARSTSVSRWSASRSRRAFFFVGLEPTSESVAARRLPSGVEARGSASATCLWRRCARRRAIHDAHEDPRRARDDRDIGGGVVRRVRDRARRGAEVRVRRRSPLIVRRCCFPSSRASTRRWRSRPVAWQRCGWGTSAGGAGRPRRSSRIRCGSA